MVNIDAPPLGRPDRHDDDSVTAVPPTPPWSPRVLVVDDDRISQLAAVALLETLGLATDVASDGREALTLSANWPYAAIFMDCGMPDVDGYTAARELRQSHGASRATPVIATTSRSRSVAMASGMDHYLAKPLVIDELTALCTRVGLLASDRAQAGPPAAGTSGTDTPLLKPPLAMELATDHGLAAPELLMTFIDETTAGMPELWRAANVDDGARLRRLAERVVARASILGVVRVADLCDQLGRAADVGEIVLASRIELELRQALVDTRAAILDRIAGGRDADLTDRAGSGPDTVESATARDNPVTTAPVRVAVADDDPLARLAVAGMIRQADGIELIGETPGVDEIVTLATVKRPDVIVLDWMMPDGGGTAAARRILAGSPDTRILALTASDSRDAQLEMTAAGAFRVLVKGGPGSALIDAIRTARPARDQSTN